MAHKGKTQLNIELDTQQSFVIQSNFSRCTTIFRDTKQFFTVHNNLSRYKTNFHGTQQAFVTQNSYVEQNSVSRCKNKFHNAQQKLGKLVTSTGNFISRDHKTSSSLPPCFENTRVSQLLMAASLIPTGDEKEIIKYYFRKGYEYDVILFGQFNGENYLQTHAYGTAVGTKMAVSFANIFMAKVETTLIQQSETKPKEWRRYIDDIFSFWGSDNKDLDQFIEQANKFHPRELTFLDTVVFKGERLKNESILYIKTHYKPTETFQYTHFNSCHPPGVKNSFIKGEAMRLLRTNSAKTTFEESLVKFKQRLRTRSYPKTIIERSLSGVNFAARPSALTQKKKANESCGRNQVRPYTTVNMTDKLGTFAGQQHQDLSPKYREKSLTWVGIEPRPHLISTAYIHATEGQHPFH